MSYLPPLIIKRVLKTGIALPGYAVRTFLDVKFVQSLVEKSLTLRKT